MTILPGIHLEEVVPLGGSRGDNTIPPRRETAPKSGVPVFLGHAGGGPVGEPLRLTRFGQLGETPATGHLAAAVRGFFENGEDGGAAAECRVIRLDPGLDPRDALTAGLDAVDPFDDVDLVCLPDLTGPADAPATLDEVAERQALVLGHGAVAGRRFVLLDAPPGADTDTVLGLRTRLASPDGALYHPWIRVRRDGAVRDVPPSGHIAGTAAALDRRVGVHKAPANVALAGAVDLSAEIGPADERRLHPEGVNVLRAFGRRGIRAWGARTVHGPGQESWTFVNVRRLFLAVLRQIAHRLRDVAFEAHTPRLWARVTREINALLGELWRRGALRGAAAEEAFFVRCDATTNPPEEREQGRVITEIGLAPVRPAEFVVIRLLHGESPEPLTVND